MESEEKKNVSRKSFIPVVYIVVLLIVLASAAVIIINFVNNNNDSEVVASVNGEEITKDDLYDAMFANGGREILDRLISNRLILQEAEALEISVSEEDIDAEIGKVIQENFYGAEDYFYQALEQYGLTEETLRNDLEIELLLRKIVRNQIEITDKDVREYYTENQYLFNTPEQVEARHILVETLDEAEKVIQMLDEGQDFSELAKEYSIDTASAKQGGNLGFFQRGEMVAEFEEAAFNLAIGSRSAPVETMHGFHIIEVLDRREAHEATFDEVKEAAEEKLLEKLVYEKMEEQINRLREEADIKYQ
ncbi:MAG: foldase [Firmicutes bacterium]|jgi:foldase protein PrsA|nr:foldase [Bacillota bacterium]